LDTSQNPYLHYILRGEYGNVYPYSMRRENYEKIRQNLDKIEFRKQSIEGFIDEYDGTINAFNLSDIFEYMPQEAMDALYENMLTKAADNARFAYWNMLAPRKANNPHITTDETKNEAFLLKDKAFFYSAFYLDHKIEDNKR
ncbi:MAG: BtaA family protein, partial [Defluviitaleaceae bacterium]|nr:BtaA family protein [Defluviitaleaceae bacterium]